MRKFDFHEFLGYIAPGMLLLVGILFIWPESYKLCPLNNITFGEFGVGIVLAYIAGQLLQTIGNVIEKLWWNLWGGMPTDWIRTGKHELIAPAQIVQLGNKIKQMLGNDTFTMASVSNKQWYSITRQVYSVVAGAGRSNRIDIFNGNYGLCRGIAACLIFLITLSLITNLILWQAHVILVMLLALAIYRMHRFGIHYGREVFVQFLSLPGNKTKSVDGS